MSSAIELCALRTIMIDYSLIGFDERPRRKRDYNLHNILEKASSCA